MSPVRILTRAIGATVKRVGTEHGISADDVLEALRYAHGHYAAYAQPLDTSGPVVQLAPHRRRRDALRAPGSGPGLVAVVPQGDGTAESR